MTAIKSPAPIQVLSVVSVMSFIANGSGSESCAIAFGCVFLVSFSLEPCLCLGFHDLDTFEDDKPVVSQFVPQFGFV